MACINHQSLDLGNRYLNYTLYTQSCYSTSSCLLLKNYNIRVIYNCIKIYDFIMNMNQVRAFVWLPSQMDFSIYMNLLHLNVNPSLYYYYIRA